MIGYISQGKLYLKSDDKPESEVNSDFIRDLKRRLQSIEDRREIFRGGASESYMSGGMVGPPIEESFHAEFSSVSADATTPGQIAYAVDAREVRALFLYDPAEKYEKRIFHGPKQRFTSISVRQEDDECLWLVAAAQDHGVSRIGVVIPGEGGGVREVTEGESLDAYPVWFPGDKRRFAYQTSGIARNSNDGAFIGLGPASIQTIDLETGEMEAIAEDENIDFLSPVIAPDGTIYFLKRPYKPFRNASIGSILKDIVLFPFRLFKAIFGFLNMFSMMFTGKPLKTAGQGPKRNGPDPKSVFLHGRWVDVESEMNRNSLENEQLPSAVPKDWELIKQDSGGGQTTMAKGVMAFTIGPDGDIYFSNGNGIFKQTGDSKKPEKISDRKMVTSICVTE